MIIRKAEKIVGEVNANGDGTWTATKINWETGETKFIGSFGLNEAIQKVKGNK